MSNLDGEKWFCGSGMPEGVDTDRLYNDLKRARETGAVDEILRRRGLESAFEARKAGTISYEIYNAIYKALSI